MAVVLERSLELVGRACSACSRPAAPTCRSTRPTRRAPGASCWRTPARRAARHQRRCGPPPRDGPRRCRLDAGDGRGSRARRAAPRGASRRAASPTSSTPRARPGGPRASVITPPRRSCNFAGRRCARASRSTRGDRAAGVDDALVRHRRAGALPAAAARRRAWCWRAARRPPDGRRLLAAAHRRARRDGRCRRRRADAGALLLDGAAGSGAPTLKRARAAARRCRASWRERCCAGGPTVWNLYGPTETTIWSTLRRRARRAVRTGARSAGRSRTPRLRPGPRAAAGARRRAGELLHRRRRPGARLLRPAGR